MRGKRFARIGAVSYALWGAIHVLGGTVLLLAALEGPERFLSAQTSFELTPGALAVQEDVRTAMSGVFAFHAFNLLWLGLLALAVAIRANWEGSATGYWLNLAVVGFTDLGLLLFIVRPGVISLSEAWIGPLLLALALVFSTLARRTSAAVSIGL
jgi:hypothetical protein